MRENGFLLNLLEQMLSSRKVENYTTVHCYLTDMSFGTHISAALAIFQDALIEDKVSLWGGEKESI